MLLPCSQMPLSTQAKKWVGRNDVGGGVGPIPVWVGLEVSRDTSRLGEKQPSSKSDRQLGRQGANHIVSVFTGERQKKS